MKKAKKYGLLMKYNGKHDLNQLAELISHLLGYNIVQALNCAFIIIKNGEYIVKNYPAKELLQAIELMKLADSHELDTELVPM